MNNCPYFERCGGCDFQLEDYQESIKQKFKSLIKVIGKFHKISPMITMEYPYGYRYKSIASFGYRNKRIISGFYEKKSHRLLEIKHCPVENTTADKIIQSVTKLANELKFTVFDEDRGRGFLRHVMVRVSAHFDEVMVVIVGGEPFRLSRRVFVEKLRKLHPEITTIVFNKNARKTSYILSKEEEILYGPGFIFESLLGYKFKLSAQSFFQINPIMMEKLLEKAFDLLPINKDDKVVDVYSGTGVIGIVASKFSQQVVAIEGNRQAVLDSRNNAFYNKSTMKTIHGDATEVLEEMAIHQEPVDIVIMDPSREGSTERFLDALNRLEPREILYISCYPPSLARDLDYLLKENKYQINHIVPVDMFPFTQHVETVVLMSRVDK